MFESVELEKVVNAFKPLGNVSLVEFASKQKTNGQRFKNAFVYFEFWRDTPKNRQIQEDINSGKPVQLKYDGDWFWNLMKNTSKKYLDPPEKVENLPIAKGLGGFDEEFLCPPPPLLVRNNYLPEQIIKNLQMENHILRCENAQLRQNMQFRDAFFQERQDEYEEELIQTELEISMLDGEIALLKSSMFGLKELLSQKMEENNNNIKSFSEKIAILQEKLSMGQNDESWILEEQGEEVKEENVEKDEREEGEEDDDIEDDEDDEDDEEDDDDEEDEEDDEDEHNEEENYNEKNFPTPIMSRS
jgi:hypothetical protein